MKKTFIENIRERDKVDDIFLVAKKESGVSKSGKRYLNLRIMDRTGELDARVWDNADLISERFGRNDFVRVKGFAVSYQSNIQVNIQDIKKVPEKEVDVQDFLPSSRRNIDEMYAELHSIIEEMQNKHLKDLLKRIFSDPDITRLFKIAPAAKSMHHSYIGGLMEHALSLCGLVRLVGGHYTGINLDLLTAGAILHDIGKIYELTYERAFDYTDEGRLLGHITIGIGMIDKRVKEVQGFPDELSILLKHMLLSHHGYLEYGSPKRPKTVEAVILYYLDDLDSKVQSIQSLIAKETGNSSKWTSYHRLYERYLYKGCMDTDVDKTEEEKVEREGELNLFKE